MSEIEQPILDAIAVLEPNAYGVTIFEYLESLGIKTNFGRLYVGLNRLEDEGYIRSDYRILAKDRARRYVFLTGKRMPPEPNPDLVFNPA